MNWIEMHYRYCALKDTTDDPLDCLVKSGMGSIHSFRAGAGTFCL
jgi:hypothetical protein